MKRFGILLVIAIVAMVEHIMRAVAGLAQRVLVMHQGRIQGVLPAEEATQERIMQLAVGLS